MCKGLAALPATCLKSAKEMKQWFGNCLPKPEKCVPYTKSRTQMMAPATKRTNLVEVHTWSESLDKLINHEVGLEVFSHFLKSEFSQENIEFWMECEEYKRKTSRKNLANKAKEICAVFVDAESPKQVNLDFATREKTGKNMGDVSRSRFDEAQRMIFLLMEEDSYKRFLKSRLFLDLVQSLPATLCHSGKEASGKQSLSIVFTA